MEAPITFKTLAVLSHGPAVPDRYFDKPNDMYAAILYGRELGIGPMEAIGQLYLVDGSVSMTAKLMSALIHEAGHVLKIKATLTKADVTCLRWHAPSRQMIEVGVSSFSMEDAKRAGLKDKPTYKQYPRTMLTNRAISQAARMFYADVISGVGYVAEELGVPLTEDPDYEAEFVIEEGDDSADVQTGE
jgi:hypothetical protein